MKKIITLILIILMCLSLTACVNELGELQEGTFEGEGFSLSLPAGWYRNDNQKGALAFLPEGYKEGKGSYISISQTDENRLDTIETYELDLKKELAAQYENTLGENGTYTIASFEKSELNSVPCYYVLSYYVKDELAFKHEQYTFDTSSGSVTISFTLADGDSYADDFDFCKSSIVIK